MHSAISDVRRFNRFYTGRIGLLDDLSASDFTLAEARVLYELARQSAETAADLTRVLGMDKAHASRILARLKTSGLVQTAVSPNHHHRHCEPPLRRSNPEQPQRPCVPAGLLRRQVAPRNDGDPE